MVAVSRAVRCRDPFLALNDTRDIESSAPGERRSLSLTRMTIPLWRFNMTLNDISAYDRSLNGNHTPACALATRGGVCDCWPPTTQSAPWGQSGGTGTREPSEGTGNGRDSGLAA
jgi:hypothetical protein